MSLPIELLERLVDEFLDDETTLRALSLTGRQFIHPIRKHRFRNVKLDTPAPTFRSRNTKKTVSTLNLLSSDIRTHIGTLRLDGNGSTDISWHVDIAALRELLKSTVNLETIVLSDLRIDDTSKALEWMQPRQDQIRTLILCSSAFLTTEEQRDFIAAFPNLDCLVVEYLGEMSALDLHGIPEPLPIIKTPRVLHHMNSDLTTSFSLVRLDSSSLEQLSLPLSHALHTETGPITTDLGRGVMYLHLLQQLLDASPLLHTLFITYHVFQGGKLQETPEASSPHLPLFELQHLGWTIFGGDSLHIMQFWNWTLDPPDNRPFRLKTINILFIVEVDPVFTEAMVWMRLDELLADRRRFAELQKITVNLVPVQPPGTAACMTMRKHLESHCPRLVALGILVICERDRRWRQAAFPSP
ncbi:hypothetical protein CYLTODRAFT_494120 [Cylindrobasidium torrendii FP15055 ss-10]|uniref:Uncharacterized protein n=1 Tax=Cylindrobasidium torrendii FP15055 ss-10 TaxID=1314674 RepID=A0A0D7B0W4_9AGAR|nr:hypothetical protein CYLTODRAFT_494120 [Cylindrobasidium torrendii FP15055 ss-10]